MTSIAKTAITFDDVLLVPAYSNILPQDTNLKTLLTQKINLNIPILSAAMDTVTESKLAISLAKEGGIGFIHKNMSIHRQVEEVKKVKRYTHAFIADLCTVHSGTTVAHLKSLIKSKGFTRYPIITSTNQLVGIITKSDIQFISNSEENIVDIYMTPKTSLITSYIEEGYNTIFSRMQDEKIKYTIVIDKKNRLTGMISFELLKNWINSEIACKDSKNRLRVGAAVGVEDDTESRVSALVEADVDIILVDSSHGHSESVLKCIKRIRSTYPNIQLIAGNVVTGSGANALVNAGADAIKVGIGPGSICTTRVITGVGVPQVTAICDVVKGLKNKKIPVISDGGIRFSGDIAKAIAAGANAVMIGSLLAGTQESPGDIEFHHGKPYKSYRGMGSLKAMSMGSSGRYFQSHTKKYVPEGIESLVAYRGTLKEVVYQFMGGLRSCMGLTGCSNINDLRYNAKFVQITHSGVKESHVHDVIPTNVSPNYSP